MKTNRYSKQREAILLELQNRKDHPTADQIYLSLKEKHPELSLGTVYRNLGTLSSNGDILKLDIGDGTCRYDGTTDFHIHYYCKNCKKLHDIDIDESFYLALSSNVSHSIDRAVITLEGICNNCSNN